MVSVEVWLNGGRRRATHDQSKLREMVLAMPTSLPIK
jgi:hypothetical protein